MMNRHKMIIIAMLSTIFAGCTSLTHENNSLIDISEIISTKNVVDNNNANIKYKVIELEFTDKAMVAGATKIIPTKDFLFVLTYRYNVLQFTTQGKFVRAISTNGRGPKEYIFASDIFANSTNDRLYINDAAGKLLEYDFDGNFIATHPSRRGVKSMIMAANGNIYESLPVFIGREELCFIERKLDGTMVDSVSNHFKFDHDNSKAGVGAYGEYKSIFENDGDIIFHQQTRDTVFTYKDGLLIPRHIFDFGRVLDKETLRNFSKRINDIELLYDYSEDTRFIYPTIMQLNMVISPYMISKSDGKMYKLDIHINDNRQQFRPRWSYDNKLLDFIDGDENTNISVVILEMFEPKSARK